MAVNAVDKLQFLEFIFPVLLLITVHLKALRLGKATASAHEHFAEIG